MSQSRDKLGLRSFSACDSSFTSCDFGETSRLKANRRCPTARKEKWKDVNALTMEIRRSMATARWAEIIRNWIVNKKRRWVTLLLKGRPPPILHTIPFGDWWEPGAPIGGNSGTYSRTRPKLRQFRRHSTENINDALLVWTLIDFAPWRYYRGSTTLIFPECFNHHCIRSWIQICTNKSNTIGAPIYNGRHTTSGASNSGRATSESKNGVNRINRRWFSFSLLEIFVWMVW